MTSQTFRPAAPMLASNGPLPRSTPSQQGVPASAISGLLDACAAARLELHSLMVLRHGHVVAEGWWEPYAPDELHLLYSLSKSFTATAVGLAVEEGLLGVDDLVVSFFPEDVPDDLHPHLARMRVRHLLSMSTGHREDTLDRLDRARVVASFLALAPEEEPGTWFTYNNGATMMLSAIVTRLTGVRLLDYLRLRLLEPLGIVDANWQRLGELDLGFSGLHLTTESVAKLGQLFLQGGSWYGQQLVPAEWVDEASRLQVDNPREPNPDWRQGYGYQFWMGRRGYRGDGAFGQFCLVLPEEDAVVAITSATEDMQAILDCVWKELLPALQQGEPEDRAGTTEGEDELIRRLAELRLPVASRAPSGADDALPWVRPAPLPAHQRAPLTVDAIEEADSGWRLTLADEHATYVVSCGAGHWIRADAEVRPGHVLRVAALGSWTSDTELTLELALVQTPHRVTLVWDSVTGRATARWNVAPLGITSPSQLALELARG